MLLPSTIPNIIKTFLKKKKKKRLDFIPCKAEQSLWGCYEELQEEEAQRYLGTQEICLEAT